MVCIRILVIAGAGAITLATALVGAKGIRKARLVGSDGAGSVPVPGVTSARPMAVRGGRVDVSRIVGDPGGKPTTIASFPTIAYSGLSDTSPTIGWFRLPQTA